MRRVLRWIVVVVVVAHGLIHLLGATKGFGWADVSQLKEPISPGMGAAWLVAGALVVLAGVLLASGVRWWWIVGAGAVVASQAVVLTSWTDARAGTVANLVLAAAVVHGYAADGPPSFRAEYQQRVEAALSVPQGSAVVTDADLAHLPGPVAAYVRDSGAVGQPRVGSFRARIHGRIRSGADRAWMTFTGEQVNTYGPEPSRLFIMDATLWGLPVDVLHTDVGAAATMRVKACSLLPMVDAAGPAMDRAETVTLFDDLCILAPAALIDAPITWQPIDADHARGTFSNGPHTVTAELAFNPQHELVDVISDDRLHASPDGKTFTAQRWSTPVRDYRVIDSRRVATTGEGRWHAAPPEGVFSYLEFHLDQITYNVGTGREAGSPGPSALVTRSRGDEHQELREATKGSAR